MKILIVDDEELARVKIRGLLSKRSEKFEILEAENGLEAFDLILSHKPQLVFLDIQMPGLTGMDLLRQLENRDFQVIFQTAYDEFAIQAFEENACDYLLKPFDQSRFNRALDRALSRIKENSPSRAIDAWNKEKGYLEKLLVKVGLKTQIIDTGDIQCFVSRDHHTYIHLDKQEYIFDGSLEFLEKMLNPNEFVRTHRKSIVAKKSVSQIVGGPNMELVLKSGQRVPVSRTLRNLFSLNQ